jgi:hypothetical protein
VGDRYPADIYLTGQTEFAGVNIEGALKAVTVEDFNEPPVLRNSVVITESDGFHFSAEHVISPLFI